LPKAARSLLNTSYAIVAVRLDHSEKRRGQSHSSIHSIEQLSWIEILRHVAADKRVTDKYALSFLEPEYEPAQTYSLHVAGKIGIVGFLYT
jgi:hypothetical protein